MGYRVAVVGATGNVGREMLNILEEVNFPVDKIHAIASRRSIGVEVSFGEQILKCEDVEQFDFSTVDVVLMSVSGSFSKEWSPKIGAAGPIVIDNSSAWRMDPDVPLIVPEVNPDDVAYAGKKNIIANPNCSTAQLVVALKPLHDRARIKRVWSRPTSRCPAPARKAWTSFGTKPRASSSSARPSPRSSPSRSPSTSSPSSGRSTTTATPTKKPRCGTRPTR